MTSHHIKFGLSRRILGMTALLVTLGLRAELVVLELQNGDRITGTVQRKDKNVVELSTAWGAMVTVPLTELKMRRPSADSAPAEGESRPAAPIITGKPAAKLPARGWKGDAQVGLNYANGIREYESYYARLRAIHVRPYEHAARQSWRNSLEYSAEYGESRGRTFQNRMEGGIESAADFSPRTFAYGLGNLGYDKIREVDLRYELGPGIGWHLLQRTNLLLNTAIGVNFQSEMHTLEPAAAEFFYRLVQDLHWRINPHLSLEQKAEYLPSVDAFARTRARFEATLKIKLLDNLSWNLTFEDLYDTEPSMNVGANEMKIRSGLGIAF